MRDLEILFARLRAELLEHRLRGLRLGPLLLDGRFLDRVVDLDERVPLRDRCPSVTKMRTIEPGTSG